MAKQSLQQVNQELRGSWQNSLLEITMKIADLKAEFKAAPGDAVGRGGLPPPRHTGGRRTGAALPCAGAALCQRKDPPVARPAR